MAKSRIRRLGAAAIVTVSAIGLTALAVPFALAATGNSASAAHSAISENGSWMQPNDGGPFSF